MVVEEVVVSELTLGTLVVLVAREGEAREVLMLLLRQLLGLRTLVVVVEVVVMPQVLTMLVVQEVLV